MWDEDLKFPDELSPPPRTLTSMKLSQLKVLGPSPNWCKFRHSVIEFLLFPRLIFFCFAPYSCLHTEMAFLLFSSVWRCSLRINCMKPFQLHRISWDLIVLRFSVFGVESSGYRIMSTWQSFHRFRIIVCLLLQGWRPYKELTIMM